MGLGNGTGERDRLAKIYGEMGDGELLELHATRGDLTEEAQAALSAEMTRRRLEPAPEDEVPMPEPLVFGARGLQEDVSGWRMLHLFHQTFEAQHAFGLLEREEIPFRVEDRSVDEAGEARPGPAVQLGLLVEAKDWSRAVRVLRGGAGLFPDEEVAMRGDGAELDEDGDAKEMVPVGQFESEQEAEMAEQLLGEAGIPFRRVQGDELDGQGVLLEVAEGDMDRAMSVLERMLEMDAAEDTLS